MVQEDLKPKDLLLMKDMVIENMGRLVAASSSWDIAARRRGGQTMKNLKMQLCRIEAELDISLGRQMQVSKNIEPTTFKTIFL
ncbi:MAG: hypothetical protein KME20_28500 [Kaiparowitsia implicata GSE-PSE-MK54-09C]|jgi:hypothetical protein|nr:hypothetical protein [Kaiparowitsia implicata GSE-PSE-MK54-09C]